MTDFKPKLVWQTENYRCVQVGPHALWVQKKCGRDLITDRQQWCTLDESSDLLDELNLAILEGTLK